MKQVLLIIFVFCGLRISAQESLNIDFNKVNKIEFKLIDWGHLSFKYYGINRYQFDEAFEYLLKTRESSKPKREIFTDKYTIMLFIAILNNLKPYKIERNRISPDEIMELSKTSKTENGIMDGNRNNKDPMETRGKICIYMKDKEIVTAFASTTTIDIFNYSYNMSSVMSDALTNIFIMK